jgi:hypothetical protein
MGRRDTQQGTAVTELSWIDAGDGYALALDGKKLVCRNPKGKTLESVPKALKESEPAEQLMALRDWLQGHDSECLESIETWMLRSLPVPRRVLEETWTDPSWRRPLENAVVFAGEGAGSLVDAEGGFFRGIDAKKGVGVVDLDGETQWLKASAVMIPHPILLEELVAFRELATELKIEQGLSQLFRETFARGADIKDTDTSVGEYSDGMFEQLNFAVGRARSQGYRVRGGFAVCRAWEAGEVVEARFWIGSDSPEAETYTGDLVWVDQRERTLKLGDVGRVAFSEGMRMASAIYAGRKVKEESSEQ